MIAWLKNKLADLEDRSRRSNIKIRGFPKTVPATQLLQYTQALFSTLVSTLKAQDLLEERIHRVLGSSKPSFLPEETPRDVLLRVHYYHVKEQILMASQRPENNHPQYAELQLLPDLSRHTLQQCRNLVTITKALRNHKVLHKWKCPAKLSVTQNGSTTLILTLEEGIAALREWGIFPDQSLQEALTPHPQRLQHSNKYHNGGNS